MNHWLVKLRKSVLIQIMAIRNESFIKCGYINIQSVGNKTMEIKDLIGDKQFDVFAITETWLCENDKAKILEMTPGSHTFLHNPRNDRRGGGVGIFISNSFSKIRMMRPQVVKSFEYMETHFECRGRKLVFIVVYRPPNTRMNAFLDEFRLYLEEIDTVSASVFVCGDFNLWYEDLDDHNVNTFKEMMDHCNL